MAIVDRRGVVVSAADPAQGSDPNPGLAVKAAVSVATTADIVLAGLQTIDSVAVGEGDRVLVKNQVDQTLNGIWNASSGNWVRAMDADSSSEFAPGMEVGVLNGVLNATKKFRLTTASPVVLGTSLITWLQVTYPLSALPFTIDCGGPGQVIQPRRYGFIEVPFACAIVRANLFADRVGSIVMDVWKTTYAGFPAASAANSICAGAYPTLAGAIQSSDQVLAGWSKDLLAGDVLTVNVISAGLVGLVDLSLLVSRS